MLDAGLPMRAGFPSGAVSLAAKALACRRGRRLLFRGLELRLEPGRITWLRGANGSGKTSLLRIVAGLSMPVEGSVTWNGAAAQHGGPAGAGIVYIGHANALNDDLTLTEALVFMARLHGIGAAAKQRAHDALSRFGLASCRDALVRNLSQGQRRRGALARLLLDAAPGIWILDEPFDALDNDSVSLLTELIDAHAARGGSVLLTSHQPVHLHNAYAFDLEPWRAT